jgi:hypothetical protein
MLFSCFSVIESLVSSHLGYLSGPLSHYLIYYSACYSDVRRYPYLCVLIGYNGANVLRF